MIWKILRNEFKTGQLIGILIGMTLGFSVILLAARFYADIRPAFDTSDLWQKEQLTISKKISGANSTAQFLGKGNKPEFSKKEIEDLLNQDFINEVAPFTASTFKTSASTKGGAIGGFYTELFFESVPSQYIDLKDKNWQWTLESDFIPIILPKTYLNLYNFGFATAQNLPQINEDAASIIPINITINGNNKRAKFEAHIIGFSDRLNTILVPQEFLNYANGIYGSEKQKISRLILITPNPSDPELLQYIESKNYDFNKEQLSNGKARMLLNTATAIVIITGLIISILALWLFLLSSQLLLQRNKTKIHHLLAIGYSQKQILQPFSRIITITGLIVFAFSNIPFFIIRNLYTTHLKSIVFENSISNFWILLGGIIFIVLMGTYNLLSIKNKIKKIL
jgi:hypothetical protein